MGVITIVGSKIIYLVRLEARREGAPWHFIKIEALLASLVKIPEICSQRELRLLGCVIATQPLGYFLVLKRQEQRRRTPVI